MCFRLGPTLNKKGLKIVDNPKIIHHFVKLLLFMIFCCHVELKNTKEVCERLFCAFLARLLILIKKGGLLQLKFGVVGVGVNIYLWAR